MIAEKEKLIVQELEIGTGAEIDLEPDRSGLRSAMLIWFSDLGKNAGPIASLRPHGLRGHKVTLEFGSFSGGVINQIRQAKNEDVVLARALIESIDKAFSVEVVGQDLQNWRVEDGKFRIEVTARDLESPDSDAAVARTCREIITPVMAAMAELIGYDVIEREFGSDDPPYEGAEKPSTILRRERNPRSRLLCIRIHGNTCAACGKDPQKLYGRAGDIIEVHHLEPLASLNKPRRYNPYIDLVPLCPCCHRAVHTRRPIPWSVEEIQKCIGDHDGTIL